MPVKKSELAGKLTEDQRTQLNKLQAAIDKKLTEDWNETRLIFEYKGDGIHNKVICQILINYKEAGWDVKRGSNQREGDWLEFN